MINRNHTAEIRTCERVKFDQALYVLTMYEKKIRTRIQEKKSYDAQKTYYEDIINSWNNRWKADLTKPVLNCVSSVEPQVYFDYSQDVTPQIQMYNQTMLNFIRRMRAEHQDQSNFKLVERDIRDDSNQPDLFKQYAKDSIKDYLNSMERITQNMKASIEERAEHIENLLSQTDSSNAYVMEIGQKMEILASMIKKSKEQIYSPCEQLTSWITSILKVMENIKESEHGSTLITTQPNIGEFTYLIHPLMLPIYANFLKQKQLKKKPESNRMNEQSSTHSMEEQKSPCQKPFKNFFSLNTSQIPKIVFINLDGYESEFNLQFARCFRKNLMYISFPKQDIHSKNENNVIYEKRFYKKLMYNFEKAKMGASSGMTQNSCEESNEEDYRYFLLNNSEDYFKNVEDELYNMDRGYEQINKNLLIFPLRLKQLQDNLNLMDNNQFSDKQYETIDVYESYEIIQIFKYFLVNQIRQFNPTNIIVSYSGRLRLQDNHFVEIMQDLTKLSQYKVIYFPNLTPKFYPSENNDHQISLKKISYTNNMDENLQLNYDFFNKIARFLKVTSGTHSLMKNFECESLFSKFRHSNVLKKMNKLMQALGYEYQQIERIRFKNKEIDLIPKLFQEDTKKVIKGFQKLIPKYYSDLYDVIKAMVTLQEKKADHMVYKLLKQFQIDPASAQKLWCIRDLVEEMKERIVLFRGERREQIIHDIVIKQIQTQKTKHFLEIAQEKYQESVLLYFKIQSNSELYNSCPNPKDCSMDQKINSMINLTGLADISFSYNKEILHIYDSTQIHYTTQQSKPNNNNLIPVLIMNHLPLDRKMTPKFDNYCAFLNRTSLFKHLNDDRSMETDVEKKVREEKKIMVYPIKLYDQQDNQILQHRFQFRVQWNYVETQQYMMLYWPSLFNMVEAVCYRLQGKVYEPAILNQVFIAKKDEDLAKKQGCVKFYRANVPDEILPRTGASAYAFNNNNIYIFGGFYEKSKNYLNLQRDVTRINLRFYDHTGNRKIDIGNIKDILYPTIDANSSFERPPNSYIRARRQFEFFQIEDLLDNTQMNNPNPNNNKKIIMIGGYGQNFIHPYSMVTYYYYILTFNNENEMLISTQKKLVYDKAIPINMRNMSKNMGIIKTAVRSRNANGKTFTTKAQLTQPDSYARFRVVYKLQKDDLKFNFQFIFTQVDCKLLKDELRKLEDEKYEVRQLSNIRLEKIDYTNHLVMMEKANSKMYVHLRLQIGGKNYSKTNMSEQIGQQLKLTHDSISFLNIINGNYICAIIKHPLFTNNQSIVAECKVKSIENQNFKEEQAPYVCLKNITEEELKGDLTLHIVEASNMNFIYVLHGYRLCPSEHIHEYHIVHNRKTEKKTITEIKPCQYQQTPFNNQMPRCCLSTFFYKKTEGKNWIVCQSYLSFNNNEVYKVDEVFDPEAEVQCWTSCGPIQPYIFVTDASKLIPINIDRITFNDFCRQNERKILVASYDRKKYFIVMDGSQKIVEYNGHSVKVVVLKQINELEIRKLQEEEVDKGSILYKKPISYIDRGYIKDQ